MNLALCWLLLRRELLVSLRRRSDLANPLFFFLIVCALFPLGLGPSPAPVSYTHLTLPTIYSV